MKEQSKVHNMSILNFFSYYFTDKWSINGTIGCIIAFFSQFLASISSITAVIGVISAVIGLGVALLSFYKLYIQVKREKFEYEQLIKKPKAKDYFEIKSEKDIKLS